MKARSVVLLISIAVIATLVVLVLGQRALWRHRCEAPWSKQSAPPFPDDPARFDPESVALFQHATDEVRRLADSAEAWARLGMIYQAHGEDALARTCYQSSLVLECRNPKAWHCLAIVEARLGDSEEALKDMARVIDFQPEYAPAHWRSALWNLELGRVELAEKFARRAMERSHADRTSAQVLGRVLVQTGRHQEALATIAPVVQKFDGDAYGHFLLGSALRDAGRTDEAVVELALGSNAQPRWDDPWEREMQRHAVGYRVRFEMAVEALNGADPSLAVPLFEALRIEKPQDQDVLVDLAMAYRKSNRLPDALAVLTEAEQLHTNSALVQLQLAGLLNDQAMTLTGDDAVNVRTQAQLHAQKAVDIAPNMAEAHGQLGEVFLFGSQTEPAVEAFEKALQLEPTNERWLVRLAGAKSLQRNWRDVLVLLQGYANRPTRNADALHLLAAALTNTGQLESAEAVLLKGLAISPNDPRLLDALPRVRAARSAAAGSSSPGKPSS